MMRSQQLIIVLLVANLLATFWFGFNGNAERASSLTHNSTSESVYSLPAVMSEGVRQKILKRFIEAFNVADYKALYELFGEEAKGQFSQQQLEQKFKKFIELFHAIDDGEFSYSEAGRNKGSTQTYILYYSLKFSEQSEIGRTGILKITLAVDGPSYQIYGIRLLSK